MSFHSKLAKASKSTIVALSGVLTGVTTLGPALHLASVDADIDSLVANVSAGVTTSSLVVKTKWQVSQDGVTYVDLLPMNGAALVGVPATGTGTLVTTAYAQACPVNVPYPYVALAIVSSGATGGAGDNITISYNFRKK